MQLRKTTSPHMAVDGKIKKLSCLECREEKIENGPVLKVLIHSPIEMNRKFYFNQCELDGWSFP